MKSKTLYCVLVAVAVCFGGGCETMKTIVDPKPSAKPPDANKIAYVKLTDPETGVAEPISVTTRSTSSPSGRAIKHLQNEDYEDARQGLAAAIADGDKTYETHFAYAVTLEKLGQYQQAIEHYKIANLADSRPDATAGRKRCQAALGIGSVDEEN